MKTQDQVFGGKCGELLASYDQNSRSWRTSQISFLENEEIGLEIFSEVWPKSGIMLSGDVYRRRMSERRIGAKDFGLLPTPLANDLIQFWKKSTIKKVVTNGMTGAKLSYVLILLDVPFRRFPNIYEWMMGYPLNWTKLNQESEA